MNTVEMFADLFEGRRDAHGTEEGGCERTPEDNWHGYVDCHLNGSIEPIGIYPMRPFTEMTTSVDRPTTVRWLVKWGCVDFDLRSPSKPAGDFGTELECRLAARELIRVLGVAFHVTGWEEITRSRGRHVWVFAEDWVPAATMRRALLTACEVAGVPTREVNPKQESLTESQLGNYVRLPYPGGNGCGPERVIVDPHDSLPLELSSFVSEATMFRASRHWLQEAADLYTPPVEAKRITLGFTSANEVGDELRRRLGGLAFTVFQNGPLEGNDRSGTLYKLAHLCRADGLTPEEGLAIITAADAEWGKFYARVDGDQRLLEMIERAYAGYDEEDE